MHKFVLCLLLCLMPLRLWAGVWMPMAQSPSHLSTGPVQHAEVHAAYGCHEAMAEPWHETHAQAVAHDVDMQKTNCHDGSCLLCSVCHQSASLAAWPLVLPVFQAHPWPVGALLTHAVRTVLPLTKPPIF